MKKYSEIWPKRPVRIVVWVEGGIRGYGRDIEGEHNRRQEAENEMEAANKKLVHLEAEVHDRDMTIMELKAKLYDLMMKEQKR